MMKPPPSFANLERMLDVDRPDGIDMRPTLLRVLTDLYLQKPKHPPADERYYSELAMRLIDAADVAARAALAARLADYPAAPALIVQRLARDVLEVAKPILEHSPCLSADELAAIADECGAGHAAIIKDRTVPTAPMQPPVSSPAALADEGEASTLAELFYAAGPMERRLILLNLDYSASAASPPVVMLQRADVWRLESAALQHNLEAVVREFERALGISLAQARRMVSDEMGEPVVVAAKAMALPADVLQRMLLFVNPHVGQSVDRVYELAELYSEISVDAARRLVTILRDADPSEHKPARHQPLAWRNAADNARRALSEIAARPAVTAPAPARNLKGLR
jgi:hypothetical protein